MATITSTPAESHEHRLTQAAADVLAERERQVAVKGWTPEHDDWHKCGELAIAAACYAAHAGARVVIEAYDLTGTGTGMVETKKWVSSAQEFVGRMWPWARKWWKPRSTRRNLVRAAALLLAEIERLDRASARSA